MVSSFTSGALAILALLTPLAFTPAQAWVAKDGAQAPAPAPAAANPDPRCAAGLVSLDYGDLDNTRARRMDYIVMNPWETNRIAALRKANPRMKILMYKNLSAVRRDRHESGSSSTGLTFDEMKEGWFLHGPDSTKIQWADYTDLYAANIAKRAYQETWLAEVKRELKRADWDGVMLDDTLTTLSHPTVGNRTPREISTDAAMYRATESALAYIGPRLKRAGYHAMPNITVFWDNWERPIKTWSKYVSGWENEFLVKWGLTKMERFTENDWGWKYEMAKWLARNRVPLLAVTYSNRSDRATQLYHRATFLLSWNGRQGASAFVPYEERVNHVTRLANLKLGKPLAAAKHRPSGLYTRKYSRGMAVVNPTGQARSVKLSQAYRRSNGDRVTRLTLPASSGELLFTGPVPDRAC